MDTTSTDLQRIVGSADPRRVSAAVDRLRSALDGGTYIEIALRDTLLDSTSEERVALLRLLDLPIEEAELAVEVRCEAGQRFLDGDASAIYDAIPELCDADDEDEEYELAG
jgi:hypothetical protein